MNKLNSTNTLLRCSNYKESRECIANLILLTLYLKLGLNPNRVVISILLASSTKTASIHLDNTN